MRHWLHAPLAILGWLLLSAGPHRAAAIGWDSNDFLISGGPNFPDRIGVFDYDLTFKGYLDMGFLPVRGLDFDAAGNVVAVASTSVRGEVRVYSSDGSRVGGFVRNDGMMGVGNDLKVAPDGTYVVGTGNLSGGDGVRQFTQDGTFLRQYGSGDLRGVAVLPGNRIWIGGLDTTSVGVFDLGSGMSQGSIVLTSPIQRAFSMQFLPTVNSVLMVDFSAHQVVERDLLGTTIHGFGTPFITSLSHATVGPFEDIFATDSDQHLLQWHRDGTFVGSSSLSTTLGRGVGILWAGSIPEPSTAAVAMISAAAIFARRRRRAGQLRSVLMHRSS